MFQQGGISPPPSFPQLITILLLLLRRIISPILMDRRHVLIQLVHIIKFFQAVFARVDKGVGEVHALDVAQHVGLVGAGLLADGALELLRPHVEG